MTEALHYGKPLIVLPLFWDQHDNAQRVDETGCGVRVDTYGFTSDDMHSTIARVLRDDAMRARVERIGRQVRSRDGVTTAADLITAAASGR